MFSTKKYYCKIDGKNYGPLTIEELKEMASEGKLQPSDKIATSFSPKFLEAGSFSLLNESFKKFKNTINKSNGKQGDLSQEENHNIIEENSIEMVAYTSLNYDLLKDIKELLNNINGWVSFMGIILVIYIILCIILAVVLNPAISPQR